MYVNRPAGGQVNDVCIMFRYSFWLIPCRNYYYYCLAYTCIEIFQKASFGFFAILKKVRQLVNDLITSSSSYDREDKIFWYLESFASL